MWDCSKKSRGMIRSGGRRILPYSFLPCTFHLERASRGREEKIPTGNPFPFTVNGEERGKTDIRETVTSEENTENKTPRETTSRKKLLGEKVNN